MSSYPESSSRCVGLASAAAASARQRSACAAARRDQRDSRSPRTTSRTTHSYASFSCKMSTYLIHLVSTQGNKVVGSQYSDIIISEPLGHYSRRQTEVLRRQTLHPQLSLFHIKNQWDVAQIKLKSSLKPQT